MYRAFNNCLLIRTTAQKVLGAICFLVFGSAPPGTLHAETMSSALARAYQTSPELNAQRADTRATDENLPNALSGYRPTASASADGGLLRENYAYPPTYPYAPTKDGRINYVTHPAGGTAQVTQNLFNGFRTQNQVGLANSQIRSSRESLRYSELGVLANAAGTYMNVLRDSSIVSLRKNYVKILELQLSESRTRLKCGEVTLTDVYQSEAALSQGRADLATANINLGASIANYQQLIGVAPQTLTPAKTLQSFLPRKIDEAFQIGLSEHPLVRGSMENVESAALAVKVAEGQLLPSVDASATVAPNYNYGSIEKEKYYQTVVQLRLTVPIYDGGSTYSGIRQAKQKLEQAQALSDQQAAVVRGQIGASWSAWRESSALVASAHNDVAQSEKALGGVREEARLGQRTTFDVLYAQLQLLNARILYVSAEHDQIVASYSLLAAMGRLSADTLGLNVARYDPTDHYDKVKDKWFGTKP